MSKREAKPTVRSAIYTRKSSEEGLALEFNSLDAQREACESYIASQAGEGWVCLPDRYDDGGYSGGSMERPALKRLLADIEAGKVDTVVIYKIDRLSRSLIDFARLMGTFEKHGVSFVAVTQAFSTANSTGRLMMNILMSFAEFERQLVSERTRDKIAAARRRGKWAGGHPVLGYDFVTSPAGSKLIVNPAETEQVRQIFDLYLQTQSLLAVAQEVTRRGWTTKRWTSSKGTERGGKVLDKCRVHALLTNVLYAGKVPHGDQVYEGEHEGIVPPEVFDRVQALLARNGRGGAPEARNKHGALLRGLLRCGSCGCAMSHSFSKNRRGTLYRYYVCGRATKNGWSTCATKSVPADEIDRLVVEQVRGIGRDGALAEAVIQETRKQTDEELVRLKAEQQALERQLRRDHADLKRLAGAPGAAATDRVADLNDRIRVAEIRSAEVKSRLDTIRANAIDEREAWRALRLFDPVWDLLSPKEQARVVQLLVREVVYDGAKSTVSIAFHPSALHGLAGQFGAPGHRAEEAA